MRSKQDFSQFISPKTGPAECSWRGPGRGALVAAVAAKSFAGSEILEEQVQQKKTVPFYQQESKNIHKNLSVNAKPALADGRQTTSAASAFAEPLLLVKFERILSLLFR